MKRIAYRKLSFAVVASVAVTTYLAAAPPESRAPAGLGSSGAPAGPGFTSQNNPGVLFGSQASQSAGNPGFSSTNNPGVAASEFGQTTAADAGANANGASDSGRSTAANAGGNGADATANGQSTATQNAANGAEHRSIGSLFRSKKDEVMVERTRDTSRDASEKTPRSATSRLFDSTLLYAGVTPIPSATPGGSRAPHFDGPANNPGLEHMSAQGLQHSTFGLAIADAAASTHSATEPARVSPVPSARPAENPAVNPVPSAPESRGISPIPRGD